MGIQGVRDGFYLAIDTSTETAGLALLRPDGVLQSELSWRAGRNHTAQLYPALDYLLRQAKTTSQGLSGLVVALGPGSFTGLRVGVAAAKGLALALQVPLVGVGTLEAAAYPFAWSTLPIWSLVDAGRTEVAAACFQTRRGAVRKVRAEAVMSPEALCAAVPSGRRALFCGEVPPAVEALLRERLGKRAVFPAGPHRMRRAGYLARLGWERLQRGDADDLTTLAPLYSRRPAVLDR